MPEVTELILRELTELVRQVMSGKEEAVKLLITWYDNHNFLFFASVLWGTWELGGLAQVQKILLEYEVA